ncbi:MAG: DinB family protein [Bacteroidota bacterium]
MPIFRSLRRPLSNSTIGQHLRHTIEFFLCLENGFREGLINYDKRAHDKLIETDKLIALSAIRRIRRFIVTTTNDCSLRLDVGYDRHSDDCVTIQTNYFRELTYNIEHAVHHMALIKIGIREVAGYVTLPADFGIAVSTLRHNNKHEAVAE